MEPVKKEKEQRLQVRKKGKKGSRRSKSYENRQRMEAQSKTKIKYISVLLISMHKHVVLKNLISLEQLFKCQFFVCDSKAYTVIGRAKHLKY